MGYLYELPGKTFEHSKVKNVLIISLGASGTHKLCDVFRKDAKWSVHHERLRHRRPMIDKEEAQRLINGDNIIYINGFVSHYFPVLRASKKIVIMRNAFDLALSWYNRREGKLNWKWIDGFNRDLGMLKEYYKKADAMFKFEDIFFKEREMRRIIDFIGLDVETINLEQKINHNKREYAGEFEDLPCKFKDYLVKNTLWFNKLFY